MFSQRRRRGLLRRGWAVTARRKPTTPVDDGNKRPLCSLWRWMRRLLVHGGAVMEHLVGVGAIA